MFWLEYTRMMYIKEVCVGVSTVMAMSFWQTLAVVCLRTSRHHHNAVWHRGSQELLATRKILPGDRITLEPPITVRLAKGAPLRRESPARNPQYDVERESWVECI